MRTNAISRVGVVLAGGLLSVWLVGACDGKSTTSDNSETHFLATCTDSCSGGLECICGVCTKPCTEASSCTDLNASAECADSCGDAPAVKICDMPCTDDVGCGSLGAGFVCNSGHCRQGAASGSGGSAGGGGSSGSGGSAGSAPSACKADPDPTPELLPVTELDPDTVARAAAVVASCVGDDGADRNAQYMWGTTANYARFYYRSSMQAECFANATCGCAALEHCWGFALSQSTDCVTGCNAGVLTACGPALDLPEGYFFTIDCNRVGQTCDVNGICVNEETVSCDTSLPDTCTSDGRPEYCDDGALWHGPVCDNLGLDCVAGACVGRGAECVSESLANAGQVQYEGVSCSGSVLEACVGGRLTSVDCATQGPGFGCQTLGTSFFCGLAAECVPAGDGASSDSHPPSCEGTTLTFCNAGRLEHVDCLALGFTGCDTENGEGCVPGSGPRLN